MSKKIIIIVSALCLLAAIVIGFTIYKIAANKDSENLLSTQQTYYPSTTKVPQPEPETEIDVNEILTIEPPKIDPVKYLNNPCYQLRPTYTDFSKFGSKGLLIRGYAEKFDGISRPESRLEIKPHNTTPQELYDAGKITKERQMELEKKQQENDSLRATRNKNLWLQYIEKAKKNYLQSTVLDKDTSCFDSAVNIN